MAFLNKTSSLNTRGSNRRAPPEPLSPKLSGLLREARWLAVMVLALYLTLVLFSYDYADPGWSHSGSMLTVHNAGGALGAWLADLLLYVFGFSAYWWVVFSLYVVWWGYRRIESKGTSDRRSLFVAVAGFVILLLASSGLEALRLYSLKAVLPLSPGGMLGSVVSSYLATSIGFTGATLILLLSMAVGFSLFTGMSWLKFMEGLGGAMENSAQWIFRTWDAWQDRRAGSVALNKREEVVEEKKRVDDHKPVHIEQPQMVIPQIPLTEREVQAPLFDNLPDSPLPPLNLLDEAEADTETLSPETLEYTSRLIERKLADFGVEVKVIAAYPGPVITRYEIEPAVGVKGSQITNLVRDLARALSVVSIRLVETIPGKNFMGLEIPNPKRQVVRLREILGSKVYADMASPLTIAMGKDIAGKAVVADLGKMPHVLVAGTTGSGKSVAINAMILSLVYKADPAKVRLILVDPKMLELSVYEGIPHLLAPVVTDMKHAANALNWCVAEMERRYRLMSSLGVRNLAGYNQKVREAEKSGTKLPNPFSLTPDAPEPLEEMPFIVVLIDELADMMMMVGKKVEELIARLAQKARASGIHLVLATQRPSVDVITGLIKANIPTRVAFQVSSKIDSRTILDQMGAEALLGQGDMLYLPPGTGYPQRVHGAYVADHEVHRVVEYLKALGAPDYVEGILDAPEVASDGEGSEAGGDAESDPMYDQAVALVLKSRRASISLVQRQLRIGYNRAARLIEQMEKAGLVSTMQSNGNREVLVKGAE
ncbi:cell division FtsK/SpoIIIE [Sulfuricella denitrificans skB26]|uniref:Cell division FtsK/SpoIIIE n=1 Tax=Sulfuricella denitrificans (strain DSM 22764 / NBRC 105220 / skB26) TaxID=1163617 RepID=S6B4N8_SULDS|nr:DNA translocase FtsK [Sulfuricella denitrificans]BAN35557.1 cell division FtsK/SpoIIIE [Sulfuricella denitrificans skB26]